LDIFKNQLNFGSRKIGVNDQSGLWSDEFCVTLLAQAIATAVLHDHQTSGVVECLTCFPIPDNGCFPLISDAGTAIWSGHALFAMPRSWLKIGKSRFLQDIFPPSLAFGKCCLNSLGGETIFPFFIKNDRSRTCSPGQAKVYKV
jgi:hypothetical protein